MGFIFVPLSSTALSGVDNHDAGVASAMLNTTQQVGGSLGTALLNTIFITTVANFLVSPASTRPTEPGFAAGSGACRDPRLQRGVLVSAGLLALGARAVVPVHPHAEAGSHGRRRERRGTRCRTRHDPLMGVGVGAGWLPSGSRPAPFCALALITNFACSAYRYVRLGGAAPRRACRDPRCGPVRRHADGIGPRRVIGSGAAGSSGGREGARWVGVIR